MAKRQIGNCAQRIEYPFALFDLCDTDTLQQIGADHCELGFLQIRCLVLPEYHILDLQVDDEWPERNDQQSSQEWRKHIASKSVPKTFPLRLEGFQEIACGRQVIFFEKARPNDEREHDADANT